MIDPAVRTGPSLRLEIIAASRHGSAGSALWSLGFGCTA
jgi:hypothetical protein